MDVNSSGGENSARRKRPASCISSDVVSRKGEYVSDVKRKLFEERPLKCSQLDKSFNLDLRENISIIDLPHPSTFSNNKRKSSKKYVRKKANQIDTYIRQLKRKQNDFNWLDEHPPVDAEQSLYQQQQPSSLEPTLLDPPLDAVVPNNTAESSSSRKRSYESLLLRSSEVSRPNLQQEADTKQITSNFVDTRGISSYKLLSRLQNNAWNNFNQQYASFLTSTVSRNPNDNQKNTLLDTWNNIATNTTFNISDNIAFSISDNIGNRTKNQPSQGTSGFLETTSIGRPRFLNDSLESSHNDCLQKSLFPNNRASSRSTSFSEHSSPYHPLFSTEDDNHTQPNRFNTSLSPSFGDQLQTEANFQNQGVTARNSDIPPDLQNISDAIDFYRNFKTFSPV